MRPLKLAIVTLLLITTAAVFAAVTEPDPVAPEKAEPVTSGDEVVRPGSPGDLKVNKAEVEEGKLDAESTLDAERVPVKSPLMTAIDAIMLDSRDRIVLLRANLEKQGNPDEAMAIQRQIEDLKVETELNILRLQADHARARGDEELARSIDESITFMTTPRAKKAPVDRPAPDAGRR
jgi:hypothetical protein